MTSTTTWVELASLLVLASFLYFMKPDASMRRDMLIIAIASWVAESSCIILYRFYQYDAPWSVFIGPMPLLVAVIWPFVIFSARALLDHVGTGWAMAFFVVLYDASLVEPVAVQAGLWSWNEPGLFGVPLIGILGWAFFSFFCIAYLRRVEGARRWGLIIAAPLLTHAALLITWWGALRWVMRSPIDPAAAAAGSALVALGLLAVVLKLRLKVPLDVMLPRMAAAGLFFALLAYSGADLVALVAYGSAFSLPYLAATRWRFSGARMDECASSSPSC